MNLKSIPNISALHLYMLLMISGFFTQLNHLYGQDKIVIPMDSNHWEYDSSNVELITHRGVKAIKGTSFGSQIFLKDYKFTNGTIEFDLEFAGNGFPGINFRMSEDQKEGENFYIRAFGPVTPLQRTTLQYAPLYDGMSMWDLSDDYQSGAQINQQGWNHIKLVVSGKQMNVYVNDNNTPALQIPELEGRTSSGGISLGGNVVFANFVLQPNVNDGLPSESGYSRVVFDPFYLRNWMVSSALDFPFGKDLLFPLPSMYGTLNESDLPDSTTQWRSISTDHRGMVNLSRLFGAVENDQRRLAWLSCKIQSEEAVNKILQLGFSDEIWVFVNGQILLVDKNYYGTPGQKYPRGRCTLKNASLKIPLQAGENELLIALANYFYGWGIIARWEDTDGILY